MLKKLWCLVVMSAFSANVPALSLENYTIYTDSSGNIYLRAPNKLTLIHTDVTIPIMAAPADGVLKLVRNADGSWAHTRISTDDFSRLILTLQGQPVSSVRYADFDGNGTKELMIALNNSQYPYLLLSQQGSGFKVAAGDQWTDMGTLSANYRLEDVNQDGILDIVDNGRVYLGRLGGRFVYQGLPSYLVDATHPGMTAGQFRVNESGMPDYTIPLSVPAGVAGVQPEISINYSGGSQDLQAGIGWSVSGMSMVTRCAKTMVTDALNEAPQYLPTDAYCLDGQRLIKVSGTDGATGAVYRPELDDFSRITVTASDSNGPTAMTVVTKANETKFYGVYKASRNAVLHRAGSNVAAGLAISEISDSFGNTISYNYLNNSAAGGLQEGFLLSNISYAKGQVVITFNHENGKVARSGYQHGARFYSNSRLASVTVTDNGKSYRHYSLVYDSSSQYDLLKSVQECVATGSSCKAAVSFDYHVPDIANASGVSVRTDNLSQITPNNAASFVDLDGDGKPDAVYLSNDRNQLMVRYSSQAGVVTVSSQLSKPDLNISGDLYNSSVYKFADVNGDLITDLLYAENGVWKTRVYSPVSVTTEHCPSGPFDAPGCFNWTQNGSFDTKTTPFSYSVVDGNVDNQQPFLADVDGDGYPDWLKLYGQDTTNQPRVRVYRNNKGVFTADNFYEVSLPVGAYAGAHQRKIHLRATGDLNGDGNTDAMVRLQSCNSPDAPARCASYQVVQQAALIGYKSGQNIAFKLVQIGAGSDQLVDVNRDGNDDLFTIETDGIRFSQSKGISSNVNVAQSEYLETSIKIKPLNFKDLNNVARMKSLVQVVDLDLDGINDLLAPVNFSNVTKLGFYKGMIGADGHWTINTTPQKIGEECLVIAGPQQYCAPNGNYKFDITEHFQYQITDVNGDGMPDLLTTNSAPGGNATWYAYSFGKASSYLDKPAFALQKITNGYGQSTEIKYGRMNDFTVYSHGDTSVLGNVRVGDDINITSTAHLVKQVISDASIKADGSKEQVSISYKYQDFVVNKVGRGVQGFRKLTTIDAQSGIETTTEYEQKWPFTGKPRSTTVKKGTETLTTASSIWRQQAVADGGTFVYLAETRESVSQIGSDNVLRLVGITATSNKYDENAAQSNAWGNLTSSVIQQFDPRNSTTELLRTTSSHIYDGWPGDALKSKRFARLSKTTVTKTQFALTDIQTASETSRISDFTYHATHGVLESEKVGAECTNAPAALTARAASNYCDTSNQRTTSYVYNSFGLQNEVTTTAGGLTRKESVVYSANGRYVLSKTNAAGLTETYRYNGQAAEPVGPVYLLDVTDANALTTTTQLNQWGEAYRTLYADGTSEVTEQKPCASSGYCNVAYDQFYSKTSKSGAPDTISVADKFGRISAKWHGGFDGSLHKTVFVYDKMGRLSQQSAPGEPAQLSTMFYDAFGRLTKTSHPDNTYTEVSYQGLVTSTRDEEGYWRDETKDGLGRTVESSDPYSGPRPAVLGKVKFWYDAYGNQTKQSVYALNSTGMALLNPVDSISDYDRYGRQLKSVDVSKGSWLHGYNGFGEQTSQQNGRAELSSNLYDNAGRLVQSVQKGEVLVCYSYGNQPAQRNNGKLIATRRYNLASGASCSALGSSALTYQELYYFDEVGRPSLTEQSRGDKKFAQNVAYDEFGRLKSQTLANGLMVGIDYQNGYQQRMYQLPDNLELSRVQAMDAAGRVTRASFIGGSQRSVTYQPERGFIKKIDISGAGNGALYSVEYGYNNRGDTRTRNAVYSRAGQSMQVNETYTYSQDGHFRLEDRVLAVTNASALGGLVTNLSESFRYNGYGNLTSKSGVGTYQYNNSANPYQLSATSGATGGQRTYSMPAASYDKHGNLLSDGQRTFAYNHVDVPTRISQSAVVTDFDYAPDNSRIYRKDTRASGVTETWYVGKSYELIQRKEGSAPLKTEHRWYVGNVVIALDEGAAQFKHEVLHSDAQGSTVAVTNGSGALLAHYLYDAWGKQSQIVTGPASVQMLIASASRRGYTGHENVDDLGIIHMNGRIYDPTLARFVQADPTLQFPEYSQSYNRYAYVLNNPMTYTDPSGYFVKWMMKATGTWKLLQAVASVPVFDAMITIGLNFIPYCQAWCAAAYQSAKTYAVTGSLGAGLRAGAITLATAQVSGSIGRNFNFAAGGMAAVNNVGLHSLVGGISAVLQGGKFGHGFFSSMVSNSLKGIMGPDSTNFGNEYGRTVVAGLVGGTVSVLTGGKFANGAATSAMQWWFNAEDQGRVEKRKEIQKLLDQRKQFGGKLDNRNPSQQAIFKSAVGKAFNYLGEKNHSFKFGDLDNMEAQINSWGELIIDSTDMAFAKAENLISVLGHESVHMKQPFASVGSQQWFDNEIEAHAWELDNVEFTGLNDPERIRYIRECISAYKENLYC